MSETARGLRELADFIDAHPEISLTAPSHMVYVSSRDAFVGVVRQLGAVAKVPRGDYFNVVKTFSGDVSLEVFTDREEVCRKVVTGTRVVPAKPATDELVEEVFEWVCDGALLAGQEA